MKHNREQGMAHAALLVAVVLLIVGATGWFVWKKTQEKKDASSTAQSSDTKDQKDNKNTPSKSDEAAKAPVIPEGFVKYENIYLGFSFAYPKEWGTFVVRTSSTGGKYDGTAEYEDLFLADFSDDKENNYRIEVRGHSAAVDLSESDSSYAKGYVKENGKYYLRGGPNGNSLIDGDDLLAKVNTRLGEVLIVEKDDGLGPYFYPEIHVNLPDQEKIVGLKLTYYITPDPDPGEGKVYTDADIAMLKKVAATFDKL